MLRQLDIFPRVDFMRGSKWAIFKGRWLVSLGFDRWAFSRRPSFLSSIVFTKHAHQSSFFFFFFRGISHHVRLFLCIFRKEDVYSSSTLGFMLTVKWVVRMQSMLAWAEEDYLRGKCERGIQDGQVASYCWLVEGPI